MTFKSTAILKWFVLSKPVYYGNTLTAEGNYTGKKFKCSDLTIKQLWIANDGTEEWRNIELVAEDLPYTYQDGKTDYR